MAGTNTRVQDLIEPLVSCALDAGRTAMDVYERDFVVETKDDRSPVTEADRAAERVILDGLRRAAPGVRVISEESADPDRIDAVEDHFFLVDPLDGTREFVRRNGEFTVNIALIERGAPILGVVYAPAIGRLFAAAAGAGAVQAGVSPAGPAGAPDRRPIRVRHVGESDALTVLASRSHTDPKLEAFLERYTVAERRSAGSSLKFCLVAAGEADLYPRLGRTMEWDTAAGQAVLECAGGSVVTFDGKPLRYGKLARGLDNPGFIARAWT